MSKIITVLDAATLGEDLDLSPLSSVGTPEIYATTAPDRIAERIRESDVVIVNKVKLNEGNLAGAKKLKQICVAATGFDNIDLPFCRSRGIAVCNVIGYSTQSVAQITVGMALSLVNHLPAFNACVADGSYSAGTVANRLTPVYHEIAGQTWGIVGYGHIGQQVGHVAEALGCRVLACKRTPTEGVTCVDIDTLCRESDIISVHVPLNDGTRGLIGREQIAQMRQGAILLNLARGAVTDEAALADAVLDGHLGGLGVDVYSAEPFREDHPFYRLLGHPNVCLTPHMAWGAFEARERCLAEMIENIRAFERGERRCRVD